MVCCSSVDFPKHGAVECDHRWASMTWCPGCEHARSKFDCCHGCGLVFGTVQSSFVCVLAFVFKVTCRHATRLIVCHVVSRCVVVPGRNTPAPSVQFEFSQFCWCCLCRSRSLRVGDQVEADVSAHTCSHWVCRWKWNFRRSDCTTLDNSLAFSGDGCWRTRCCDVFSSGSGRSVSFGLFEPATSVDLRAC